MPQINSNEVRRCRECQFCTPMQSGIIGCWVGECRRFPPLIIVVPDARGQQMVMKWPVVQDGPGFYCFEFVPKIRPGDVIDFKKKDPHAGPFAALDRLDEQIRHLVDQVNDYFHRDK